MRRQARPLIAGLTRGQFGRIVMPSAMALILWIAYVILFDIYGLSMEADQLPNDGILFCVLWVLLVTSFLRGSCTSPGLVRKGWYRLYPDYHAILKDRFRVQQKLMGKQNDWMTNFNKTGHNHPQNNEEQTKLLANDNNNNEDGDAEDDIDFPEDFSRPPRSHYCHEVACNVQRMDHFCLWYNNPVGFRNYKFFILTLIYLWCLCVTTLGILIYRVFINVFVTDGYGYLTYFVLFLAFVFVAFFTVFSTMHLYLHLWQCSKNLTSIEYFKYLQFQQMARHFQVEPLKTHEFDHGMFENCKKMIGYDVWFWLIPLSPSLREDGYKFQINRENQQKFQEYTQKMAVKRKEMYARANLYKNKHKKAPASVSIGMKQ